MAPSTCRFYPFLISLLPTKHFCWFEWPVQIQLERPVLLTSGTYPLLWDILVGINESVSLLWKLHTIRKINRHWKAMLRIKRMGYISQGYQGVGNEEKWAFSSCQSLPAALLSTISNLSNCDQEQIWRKDSGDCKERLACPLPPPPKEKTLLILHKWKCLFAEKYNELYLTQIHAMSLEWKGRI